MSGGRRIHVAALLAAGTAYFAVGGATFTILPRLVKRELDGGELENGLAFAVYTLGMLVVRPFVGWVTDVLGRRTAMILGAVAVGGLQLLVVPAAEAAGLGGLLAVRFLAGVAASALYVAQATMATELPSPGGRSQVFALYSVSVVVGLAIGPVLGEEVLTAFGFTAAFATAAACAFLVALFGLAIPETRPPGTKARIAGARELFEPTAVRLGVVNLLVLVAFMGFSGFVVLYAEDELGLERVAPVLLLYSATTIVLRATAGRAMDRMDRLRLGSVAQASIVVAALLLALVPTVPALYLAAPLMAGGLAFQVPLTVMLGAESAAAADRARVVSTISAFGDLANFVGSFGLGWIASGAGYRVMYLVVAGTALAGLVLFRSPFLAPVTSLRRPALPARDGVGAAPERA
ncbi:MAG: MFS transporter [Acidimicrobiales bacterium]|jgi:MFS family permease|nr:MFS transporter [Acidimicrobiales bacterium]